MAKADHTRPEQCDDLSFHQRHEWHLRYIETRYFCDGHDLSVPLPSACLRLRCEVTGLHEPHVYAYVPEAKRICSGIKRK
jgi:hypothetical protein